MVVATRKFVLVAAMALGVVVGLSTLRFFPPSFNRSYLVGGGLMVCGVGLLVSSRLSRAPMSPAHRRRITALGLAQTLLGYTSLFDAALPTLAFQGLIVIFMLLIPLGIPRRLFADPSSSG